MKYIKNYKIFESIDEIDIDLIKSNINDIFQELIDINYQIEIEFDQKDLIGDKLSYKIEFKLKKQNDAHNDTIDFPVSEIKEYILRMMDYLKSEGITVDDTMFLFTMPKLFKSFTEFENIDTDREIYVFNMHFWYHKQKSTEHHI